MSPEISIESSFESSFEVPREKIFKKQYFQEFLQKFSDKFYKCFCRNSLRCYYESCSRSACGIISNGSPYIIKVISKMISEVPSDFWRRLNRFFFSDASPGIFPYNFPHFRLFICSFFLGIPLKVPTEVL